MGIEKNPETEGCACYAGLSFALLIKQTKEREVAPRFEQVLGASVTLVDSFDTDTLGSFTRDVPRFGSQKKLGICETFTPRHAGTRGDGDGDGPVLLPRVDYGLAANPSQVSSLALGRHDHCGCCGTGLHHTLYSEDLNYGQSYDGVGVVNPFPI
jgi:hypothetical protein